DFHVTGVQTCALPISRRLARARAVARARALSRRPTARVPARRGPLRVGWRRRLPGAGWAWAVPLDPLRHRGRARRPRACGARWRSEERRVGTESRARW